MGHVLEGADPGWTRGDGPVGEMSASLISRICFIVWWGAAMLVQAEEEHTDMWSALASQRRTLTVGGCGAHTVGEVAAMLACVECMLEVHRKSSSNRRIQVQTGS